MADRYFDRNGATAGFGTLTGAWDTTTASWSTSPAGNVTPTAYTFTDADAAYFGSASVALTTAGTATISTGRTITLNGIYTRNLSAGQSIAAAGTGNLVFAGTTPFVNLTHGLGITAPISGTAGLTVNNASKYINCSITGNTAGLSGPCVVLGGSLFALSVNRYVPSSLTLSDDTRFGYSLGSADYDFPVTPSGTGAVQIRGNFAGNGVTFPASGTGSVELFNGALSAMGFSVASLQNCKIVTYHLPGGFELIGQASGVEPILASISYVGSGQTRATGIIIDSANNTQTAVLTAGVYRLLSSGSGAIVLTGLVQRQNNCDGATPTTTARMDLTLGGSNTGDNTLSGDISEVGTLGAILGIRKVDAGRWVLSGANSSHTGIHSISAGTLSAQSAKALGSITSSGGIVISDTGTLELAGGVTVDKSQTPLTLRQGFGVSSVGDNTLITSSVFLTGNTTAEVTDGNRLFLDNRAAIVDGSTGPAEVSNVFGITKTGGGELQLGNTLNRFDGVVAVNAGTLTVNNVFSAGTQQNLGTGTTAIPLAGTLKFIGTSGFMNRSLTLTGPSPALDCSGSGNYEFQNATQTNEARTLTLKGTSTGLNEVTFALGDTSFATGLAKDGTGRWTVSGALSYSGATDVDAGTLRLARADGNTMTSTVTVDAGATLELVTDTLPGSSGTAGRVLGTGNVTVNGDVKTRGGVVQKGQMRYGGNLTFGAGSKLWIGAAA